jgi:CheY-like chemotaxis protein
VLATRPFWPRAGSSGEQQGALHLLLTDIIMPGMNGREVADELRRNRPDLRLLYVLDTLRTPSQRRGVLDSGIEFLEKLFTTSALWNGCAQLST